MVDQMPNTITWQTTSSLLIFARMIESRRTLHVDIHRPWKRACATWDVLLFTFEGAPVHLVLQAALSQNPVKPRCSSL